MTQKLIFSRWNLILALLETRPLGPTIGSAWRVMPSSATCCLRRASVSMLTCRHQEGLFSPGLLARRTIAARRSGFRNAF